MLKIKQTYHGTGSAEGYRYRVYKNNRKIGDLKKLPRTMGYGSIVKINDQLYQVIKEYDCNKKYSKLETVWYELIEFEFKDYTDLKWKEKGD